MTRSIEQIVREIDTFEIGPDYMDRLELLMDDLPSLTDGTLPMAAVLRLIERSPQVDFGSPGPLVHAIETFFGRGYEEELLQSLARRPTALTVWMLNRIINGTKGAAREYYLTVLNQIANDASVDSDASESAKHFAAYQNQE